MKKFLICLSTLFLMTSCEYKIPCNSEGTMILKEGFNTGTKIDYIIFNDHRYVRYMAGSGLALDHDPDCPFCKTSTQD